MIVLVSDRWAPHGGGRERYLAQLAAFLAERGEAVEVLCRQADAGAAAVAATVRVHAFPGPTWVGEPALGRALARLVAESPGSPVLAARPQPEASHYQLHSGLLGSAFAAERASFRSVLARALYWPMLRLNPRRGFLLRAERRVLAGPARLMVFTAALAGELQEQFGVAAERITVCPPGVDLDLFTPGRRAVDREWLPRQPYFVLAGHNFQLKGLGPALAALAELRRQGCDAGLVVAGRGRATRWRRRAARLGLGSALTLAGDLGQQDLAALYRQAVALLHPAYYDPYPRVIPEALACGCPVLTAASCGGAEVVEPGRTGLIVARSDDTDDLAAAMRALLSPDTRAAMSAAAVATRSRLGLTEHLQAVARWLASTRAGAPQEGATARSS